ncbi:MAG: DUF2062 domain-containing protein [Gammaproteobacteria bacterium]|nr:DUF2062 domain-containing protein [Gammaproteobacteria bacterium]
MRLFFKKWLPNHTEFQREPKLRWLNSFLFRHQNLWHINRHSVARGFAVGLLVCFLPIPFQMLLAALLALWFRANLPISVIVTWITNPLTFLPFNFFIYKIGEWVLGKKNTVSVIPSIPAWQWKNLGTSAHEFYIWFLSLGKTYLVGLPIMAFGSALLGYFAVQIIWRIFIYWQWRQRINK